MSKYRKRGSTKESNNGFTISFTSLVMILLSFFIYLNSMATPSAAKKNQVLRSINQNFNYSAEVGPSQHAQKTTREVKARLKLNSGAVAGSFAEQHAGLLKQLEPSKLALKAFSDRLLISFPAAIVFSTADNQLSAQALESLRIIARYNLEHSLAIRAQVNRPYVNSDELTDDELLPIEQSTALMRFFLDEQLPSEALSIRATATQEADVPEQYFVRLTIYSGKV